MRILVLTQVAVYPADAGPKIKTLHVIQHLAKDHEVLYCTFVRTLKEQQEAEKLYKVCRRICTVLMKRTRIGELYFLCESLARGDSFLLHRDDRPAMHAMVRQLLDEEHIDVLHVDQLNMMRFVPADWPGKVILDEHNAVWQVVERLCTGTPNPFVRWLLRREVDRIQRLEGEACHRANIVLTVSQQDKQALQKVAGESVPIKVVPITVDVETLEVIRAARNPQKKCLLTVGTLYWPPNSEGISWWLRKGYEKLQNACPDLIYDIVGARPSRELQSLARRWKGINVHGYVVDIQPFWVHATALVVPLLSGGGVRVKILEAMAMGVPVISTTIGCEGLAVRDGEHLLIADTPEAFADACVRLLCNQELADHLTQHALRFIREQHDAKVMLHELDVVYA